MSQIDVHDDKQDLIVEAALKRFAHYGPAKTTMNEIADDLRLSKALIYYYFPDKASLFTAVLEKILDDYFLEISCEANHAKSVEIALMNLNEVRHEFFTRYFLNMGLNRNFLEGNKNTIDKVVIKAMNREKNFVAELFEKANASGEMVINKIEEKAELYLDLIKGIRFSYIMPGSCTPLLDSATMQEINKKHQLLTEIFIKAHKNSN
ncbi:TetR/AcrR family transcriptional regulator [Solitalea lacus]|uniref:TetR/AcrR family transcriptional regulator n=1 Tax=Solitalea lacus TaxID=2911172 RepID=UPI001EDAF902|nr:TetR/AcrR family transcriptional regulator [Solitalea lacus]UKJ09036.1 TetR/AcrR family transcriptional regulator [Solitalea lacus]